MRKLSRNGLFLFCADMLPQHKSKQTAKIILFINLFNLIITITRQSESCLVAITKSYITINFSHEISPNRESHRCSLTHRHIIKVNITVFTTNPNTRYKLWSKSHKPSITVFIRSTSLSSNFSLKMIFITNASTSTTIDYTLKKHEHLISTFCTNNFIHTRLECRNHISFIILYLSYKHRRSSYTMICKCCICTNHFLYTDITRA